MAFGPTQVGWDPTSPSNMNDLTPRFKPGAEVEYNGNIYMYVRFDNGVGNVASIANCPAYWMDRENAKVTSDKTSSQTGASLPSGCAGIFQGVVTDQYFTWIQRRGYRAKVRGDGAGVIGAKIHAPASDADLALVFVADGSAAAGAIPAERVGTQLAAADASNDAPAYLSIFT